MALTKKQIARSIQQGTDVSFALAYELVETTFEIIKATLANGEDVLISGFGKFKVIIRIGLGVDHALDTE